MPVLYLHVFNKPRFDLLPKRIRASSSVPTDESICGNNEVFVAL